MPFFGKKSEKMEKKNAEPSYPRQQAPPPPPQVAHHPMPTYPQGAFVNNTDQFIYTSAPHLASAPNGAPSYTVAFQRGDLPGASDNFCEGFLDGPDFSNRVPDRNIPPAPGSYYFYSYFQHGNGPSGSGPTPSYSGPTPSYSGPNQPPPMPAQNNECPPPPSYDDVLSQEMKKKL